MLKPFGVHEGKEFRFAVSGGDAASPDIRSRSFRLWSNKGEAYLACREENGRKLSIHSGGITRFAEPSDGPRLPLIHSRIIGENVPAEHLLTVAHVLLTSESGWDLDRGSPPKRCLKVRGTQTAPLVWFAIDWSPRHPHASKLTTSSSQLAVLPLGRGRYVTLRGTAKFGLGGLPELKPHPGGKYQIGLMQVPRHPAYMDVLVRYQSPLSTYITWIHHDVPLRLGLPSILGHPLAQIIEAAYTDTGEEAPFAKALRTGDPAYLGRGF